MKKPELLAPAGDLEKLKAAIIYGADAVYMGGHSFGLRANSKNFGLAEMKEAIDFAHSNNSRVYVTANIFAHNNDIAAMPEYFSQLGELGVDALIISDPGVFSLAKEVLPNMEIHISTQANNTNYRSAMFWHQLGAKRIVLARELSLNEISEIRQKLRTDFEIECFIHGAMCISYSGRCLLSSYLSGRDSNRGDCSQACRWKYGLVEENRPGEVFDITEEDGGTYILNSKDMCLIEHIPELVAAGIDSFKIEGRMKTPYYVACIVKAYREAIDDFFADPAKYQSKKEYYRSQVERVSHRAYTTGFYHQNPGAAGQIYESSSYARTYDFVAVVKDYDPATGFATIQQRNKFSVGDEIEIFRAKAQSYTQRVQDLQDENGQPVESAPHPQQILKIKLNGPVEEFDMLRKEIGRFSTAKLYL